MSYNIKELLDKYKKDELTDAERNYLMHWYNFYSNDNFFKKIEKEDLIKDVEELNSKGFQIIYQTSSSVSYKWISLVASVLLVGIFSLFFIQSNRSIFYTKEIVVAGSKKAELMLHNGDKIVLDSLSSFEPIVKDNVKITKADDGTIKYAIVDQNLKESNFDELITPKGGEYKIQLVDGTKVWINANSSLKFFTNVAANTREVWLDGEGYFEVAKNKDKPFIVHTSQQEVRVTGTSFNIKSNSSVTHTTLVEGEVRIHNGKVILKPYEQLSTENNIDKAVIKVNVDNIIAWKNGYFIFNNYPMNEVFSALENWYDVKFVSNTTLKNHMIWATISRSKSIDEVLKSIELTGVATFKRKERRIEVKQ